MDSNTIVPGTALAVIPSLIATRVARRKATKLVRTHADGAPVANPSPAPGVVLKVTKGGEKRYLAQARVKGHKPRTRAFATLKEGTDWKSEQETEMRAINKVGGPTAQGVVPPEMLMPEVFDHFVKIAPRKGFRFTERQMHQLAQLARHPLIAKVRVRSMDKAVITAYCESRRHDDKVHPSTIKGEYTRISQVIKCCASWLGWGKYNPLDAEVRKELFAAKLLSKSAKRHVRPSQGELVALIEYFNAEAAQHAASVAHFEATGRTLGKRVTFDGKRGAIPMADMVMFASIAAFRLGEITDKLLWSELRENGIWCWRKDPKSEVLDGPHMGQRRCFVPISEEAMAIIKRQPKLAGEDRIFPAERKTITGKFTVACKALAKSDIASRITQPGKRKPFTDLHFHDLRHEAISEMVQHMEYIEVMAISGHKTVDALLTYVDLEEQNAKLIVAKMKAMKPKYAQAANEQEVSAAA